MKLSKLINTLFIYINVGVLLFSCVETSYVASDISFNTKKKPRSVFDTGIIKGVELVKLESDGCIVGNIDKIICHDSLLYILDKYITKGVYVFTQKGRFVNKISRCGHGKCEYAQLNDIFFYLYYNKLCMVSRSD